MPICKTSKPPGFHLPDALPLIGAILLATGGAAPASAVEYAGGFFEVEMFLFLGPEPGPDPNHPEFYGSFNDLVIQFSQPAGSQTTIFTMGNASASGHFGFGSSLGSPYTFGGSVRIDAYAPPRAEAGYTFSANPGVLMTLYNPTNLQIPFYVASLFDYDCEMGTESPTGGTYCDANGSFGPLPQGLLGPGQTYVVTLDHFNVNAGAAIGGVPEPASWTMLIAGFGLTGAALRRRRRIEAAVSARPSRSRRP